MSFSFRTYQKVAVEKGVDYFEGSSKKTPIIVAPTAAGKSWIIAGIAGRLKKPLLVLQPRKELLQQNYEKLIALGGKASVYSASMGQKEIGSITYATIGSIVKISEKFQGYDLIIDECHLYSPKSQSMFGMFIEGAGIKKALGLTATPFRLKSMGGIGDNYSQLNMLTRMRPRFFNEILHVIQVEEMVRGGYWSPLRYFAFDWDGSLLRLNSTGSDFTERSIAKASEQNSLSERMAKFINDCRKAGRKSILGFRKTVEESYEQASLIPGAEVVHGAMGKRDRKRIIEGFRNLDIPVVINVDILSVGFDHPKLDAIVVGRPTMSLAWYYQALGRGTRIDTDGQKKSCIIADFSGNVKKFGRVELLKVLNVQGFGWGVFGAGGKLLTNLRMDRIGDVSVNNIYDYKKVNAYNPVL